MTKRVVPMRDMAYVSIVYQSGLTYNVLLDITPNDKYPKSDSQLSRDKLDLLLNTTVPLTFTTLNLNHDPEKSLLPDKILPDSETVTIKQAHIAYVRVQYKREPVTAHYGTVKT